MFKRIKQLFESIAYAGLRPTGGKRLAQEDTKKTGRFAPLRERIEKFLNSGSSHDPLYLSSRSTMQKTRFWLIVGVVPVLLLVGLGLVLIGFFDPTNTAEPPPAGLSNAEIAKQMLPDLDKDLHIDSQHDVDVQDVHITHTGSARVAGMAVNNTDHVIPKVEIVFELTDKDGSRQGAVSTQLINLPAKANIPFQFAIDQQAASFALVREVHNQ